MILRHAQNDIPFDLDFYYGDSFFMWNMVSKRHTGRLLLLSGVVAFCHSFEVGSLAYKPYNVVGTESV